MKLVPRLVLLGGALPLVGVVLAVLIAGNLFRSSLLADLDRRLMAQAAVESVSLFDGPQGRPHLHLVASSFADEVAAFAASTTVFDHAGDVLLSTLDVPPALPDSASWEETASDESGYMRVASRGGVRMLSVRLVRSQGDYTMLLSVSLEPLEATMRAFYRDVLGTVAVIWALLFTVLVLQGRRIVARIEALRRLAPAIREGARAPAIEVSGGDELTELSDVLREAADTLADFHDAQDRFLASAAHQLRTPVTLLRTEIDLALRKPRDAEHLREALCMARAQAEHLGSVAVRLLDFESLRSARVERAPAPVGPIVDEVLSRWEPAANEKAVRLRCIDRSSRDVCIDAMLVEQAVENLVGNAVRFAPADTVVSVEVEEHDGTTRVMVYDEGPGFDDSAKARLFQPFAPGRGDAAQTGLGLAFVAEIARKHGGRPLLNEGERTGVGFEVARDPA